jgi:hypothetical protein
MGGEGGACFVTKLNQTFKKRDKMKRSRKILVLFIYSFYTGIRQNRIFGP